MLGLPHFCIRQWQGQPFAISVDDVFCTISALVKPAFEIVCIAQPASFATERPRFPIGPLWESRGKPRLLVHDQPDAISKNAGDRWWHLFRDGSWGGDGGFCWRQAMRSIWRRVFFNHVLSCFIHKSSALGVGLMIFWKGLAAVWFQDALHQHLPVGAMDETQYSYFLWGLEDWALSRTRLGHPYHPYLLETSEPFQLHESAWESLKNPFSR